MGNQCVKGDNCSFRHDMDKRGKVHHQIRLRILSCSRMSENHREPEVLEEKVPVVECLELCTRRSPLMEVMDTMMIVLDHICFLVRSLMVRSLRLGHVLAGAD